MPWYDATFPCDSNTADLMANSMRFWQDAWLVQTLANAHRIAETPSVLSLMMPDVPLVIIAPGPSLDNNIGQLQALKGRVILLASSHALSSCRRAGVVPDFVMTLDAQAGIAYHFEGYDTTESEGLILAASVHPSLWELPGRQFHYTTNPGLDSWAIDLLDGREFLSSGGSVSGAAMSLGIEWGCNPIVFVGQDLSFPGGQYYARSSDDGEMRMALDGNLYTPEGGDEERRRLSFGGFTQPQAVFTLPGYYGGEVPSSRVFDLLHRWMGHVAGQVSKPDGVGHRRTHVINATEGGAFIPNMAHTPLRQIEFPAAGGFDLGAVIAMARRGINPQARRAKLAAAARVLESDCADTVIASEMASEALASGLDDDAMQPFSLRLQTASERPRWALDLMRYGELLRLKRMPGTQREKVAKLFSHLHGAAWALGPEFGRVAARCGA